MVASHIENGEVWRQSSPQSACQLLKAVVNVIVTKTEAHEPEARIGRSLEEASHLGCDLIATALEACEVHLGHANPAQGEQDSCRGLLEHPLLTFCREGAGAKRRRSSRPGRLAAGPSSGSMPRGGVCRVSSREVTKPRESRWVSAEARRGAAGLVANTEGARKRPAF